MTRGTQIRTILRIVTSLNTAIYAVTAAVQGLHFDKLNLIWAIVTIVSDFAVAAVTTYYNNDYTEEAALATAEMRNAKNGILVGRESLVDAVDPDDDCEEEES